uniref:Putative senescence-associated protein n=1 Tax=Pisum sativum TaxID=3888 RepID=Q9AVH9_PEA|nr:putative senescence-associated protein [Pisum sativum]
MLGRLASIVAKELSMVRRSFLVRCEEICISGGLGRQKMKYMRFLRRRMNTKPSHGPITFVLHPRSFGALFVEWFHTRPSVARLHLLGCKYMREFLHHMTRSKGWWYLMHLRYCGFQRATNTACLGSYHLRWDGITTTPSRSWRRRGRSVLIWPMRRRSSSTNSGLKPKRLLMTNLLHNLKSLLLSSTSSSCYCIVFVAYQFEFHFSFVFYSMFACPWKWKPGNIFLVLLTILYVISTCFYYCCPLVTSNMRIVLF